VIFLLILIRLFNVDNIFLGSDLTSLVFAINAGILMERNGIYRENSVRDFAMIFPIFMFAICFLCLLALFIHSQNVYPVFDNDYFKPIFSILVIILAVFSILIGLFYALQSRLRF
jgi:succinate dehydrogenase hydrophobic anchor subunit